MAFKRIKSAAVSAESPEALLRDLRSKTIPGPLAHQADLWRAYQQPNVLNMPDVALQLPTGSGKTLVGLILGEWRRAKFGERVVYLCPTNQLVHQVVEQATNQYGLKLHGFVGKKKDYTPGAKGDYLGAEAIAVTSYSSVFNTAPFFDKPDILILDDAHAAENYISKFWSMRISKVDQKPLYVAILNVFLDALSPATRTRLSADGKPDPLWVEKIPTPLLKERHSELLQVLDSKLNPSVGAGDEELERQKSDIEFTWPILRDHLLGCHLYFDAREILIRPLIPPTFSHKPFAGAKQRIYMSATLGEGGELERITGRQSITRLAAPGWEQQGIGRRFFIFPERSLTGEQTDELLVQLFRAAGRSLVLVPDDESARRRREWVKDKLGFPAFDAKAIEVSKQPFLNESRSVAVVANRYDGIDFPGDQCRLMLVSGLPKATNLQEKFLINRLGSVALLNDRILTRMVQAFGRCTRSPQDWAAVIVESEELLEYLLPSDRRKFLHPELQAEVHFGIEQSKEQTVDGFHENVEAFLAQSDQWKQVEAEIIAIRNNTSRQETPGAANLKAAVDDEVRYQSELWQGNYPAALDAARAVLGKLTDPTLRAYRAAWSYLAGSAATLAGVDVQAKDQFAAAAKAAPGLAWLADLSRPTSATGERRSDDANLAQQIEQLESSLMELGTLHDRKFAQQEHSILERIEKTDKVSFESAHEDIGRFIGFQAGKKESTGSPDPWWVLHDGVCLVFEDHAGGSDKLDVTKARQAASHPKWIEDNVQLAKDCKIIPVLVTPVTEIEKEVASHLKDVFVWPLSEFRAWVRNAVEKVRQIRRTFQQPSDLAWRADASTILQGAGLDAAGVLETVLKNPAPKFFKVRE